MQNMSEKLYIRSILYKYTEFHVFKFYLNPYNE